MKRTRTAATRAPKADTWKDFDGEPTRSTLKKKSSHRKKKSMLAMTLSPSMLPPAVAESVHQRKRIQTSFSIRHEGEGRPSAHTLRRLLGR